MLLHRIRFCFVWWFFLAQSLTGFSQISSHSGQGFFKPSNQINGNTSSLNSTTNTAAESKEKDTTNTAAESEGAALTILAKESIGLESALSLLRSEFEKLQEEKVSASEFVVDPEDLLFGNIAVAQHDIDMTLLRYLRVARSSLSKSDSKDDQKIMEVALERIKSTLKYRKDYDILAMHAPGMARKLIYHDTNPGACLYAADSGLTDKKGRPALIGRLGLMMAEDAEQHEPIVPANHLRAIIFAFERLASSLRLSEGKDRAYYILDCSMDKSSAPDLYDTVDPRPRNWSRFGSLSIHGLTMSGWKDKSKFKKRTIPGVLPHLDSHKTITPGLPVLREALRQLTKYYPNIIEKVYFLKAPFSFRAFMKVFKLMVDKESAEKFVVVPWGSESKILLDVFDETDLPIEFGGKGRSLGRDDFLRTAADRYEKQSLDFLSSHFTEEVVSKAMKRSENNDYLAGVVSTKKEATSISGTELINGAGVRLFMSKEENETPLGEFNQHTELVILRSLDNSKEKKEETNVAD